MSESLPDRSDFYLTKPFSAQFKAKLKKNVCLALPTQGFTWWVGRSPFFSFFLNIYYSHMDGNGKKNLRFGEKKIEKQQNRLVGRQCQTNYFS